MADDVMQKNRDDDVPAEKKLGDLYKLIEGIDVAMFTTRRADGHLVSRPMQTQAHRPGVDLWFVTDWSSDKLDDVALDPHVNLAYYNTKSREWVSVAGTAIISRDRDLIQGFYKPDWKAWFPSEDGNPKRDGGPNDERIALVLVEAHSVEYMKQDRPRPLVLFEIVKALATGSAPKVGDIRHVGERELRADRP